ncbi:mei2 [Symbiodinium natans]|uniref:Mei2 protein n=1 Tax=Symbiodinium natans TaxID=878477 RepID=A0A812QBS1_9DINO|nr:mei2 [Symbiodinium natans]
MPMPPAGASAQALAQYAANLQAMAHQFSQMASVAASQEMANSELGPLGGVGMGMSINPWLLPGQGAVPVSTGDHLDARRPEDGQLNGHKTESAMEPAVVLPESKWVTVMLRNLPNDYSRDDVVDLLNSQGFLSRFDFVYLPIDFKNSVGLGYAFINMVSHEDALQVKEKLSGFKEWKVASQKVCEVAWGNPEQQGLESHISRYRNSPVMHNSVPEEFKPLLFANGVKVPFPEPTKAPRRPRMKKHARIGCRSPEASEEEDER